MNIVICYSHTKEVPNNNTDDDACDSCFGDDNDICDDESIEVENYFMIYDEDDYYSL